MIINLNEDNVKKVEDIIKKHDNVIILYFSDLCYHCNVLKPTWFKLCTHVKNSNDVVIINAESNNIKHFKEKYKEGVSGYPTILKYCNGKRKSEYVGERDLRNLKKFITKII
jgi:thioredoxin-like negative regulator of GroEL